MDHVLRCDIAYLADITDLNEDGLVRMRAKRKASLEDDVRSRLPLKRVKVISLIPRPTKPGFSFASSSGDRRTITP